MNSHVHPIFRNMLNSAARVPETRKSFNVSTYEDNAQCDGITIGRRPYSIVFHPDGHVVAYFVSASHKSEAKTCAELLTSAQPAEH